MSTFGLSVCPYCQGEYTEKRLKEHIRDIHPEQYTPPERPINPKSTAKNPFTTIKAMLQDENEILQLMRMNRELRADINGEKPKIPDQNPLEIFDKIRQAQKEAILEERERIAQVREMVKLENVSEDDFEKEMLKNILGGALQNVTNTNARRDVAIPEGNKQPTRQDTANTQQDKTDIKGL